MGQDTTHDGNGNGNGTRWRRRGPAAALLRLGVLCGPVVASFAAAYGVHRLLPPVTGHLDRVWHLVVLVAVSTAVLLVVDRLGRRLLPLVTLLDLSMLFPDNAPSRVKVAREAIRRRPIEEQLARVRDAGADPGAVAREILTLVAALSAHDKPTRGHAERVRMFTDLLAAQLGIPARDRDLLRWAAILHDVGKLRVPASLLNKPGKPTDEEWAVLRAHPAHGAETAAGLLPWLGEWADVIVQHHERYDGTGYPTGLAESGISLGARIVSVADAYDVMTAARAYKRPVSRAAALQELIRFSGSQFDPQVVRAMVAVGAPRLRRAQGAIAWLADIPLVAGAVPATTLARVVGAGALATSAATGATAMALPTATPTVATVTSVSSAAPGEVASGPTATSPGSTTRRQATDRSDSGDGPVDARAAGPVAAPVAEHTEPADAATPGGGQVDEPAAPATTRVDGAGPSTPTAEPTKAGSGTSSPSAAPPKANAPTKDPVSTVVGDTTEAVGTVTGTVTGTVGGVVADPVGTVTGAVADPVGTVSDTVGTVTGTVGTVTGTVTGAVGTLLGSGSGGSGSGGSGSTSPNSGPGSTSSGSGSGGLLGGLLGH